MLYLYFTLTQLAFSSVPDDNSTLCHEIYSEYSPQNIEKYINNLGKALSSNIEPVSTEPFINTDTKNSSCLKIDSFGITSLVGQNIVSDAGMGTITIRSPIAADIYVDHKIVGQITNGTLELPVEAGEHIIRVATDNYAPFVRRISVQATQNVNLIAEFTSSNGSVEFQSPIRGAIVIIDNQEPMNLPIRMEDLATGTHAYIVTAPTFEPLEGTFNFEVGKNLYFYSDL